MADRRKRLHREMIDAIPRDRVADTVIPALSIIEQDGRDEPGGAVLRGAVG